MIKMNILPNREGWLKNRNKFIGGSDAACIIGMNPWKSNLDLWEEKAGIKVAEDISENPNVKFGTEAEPIIRELFKLNYPQYEVLYVENNSWTNDKYPWAAVSHDGWLVEKETGRKGIWECKTSEIVSSIAKKKWREQIPDNYYCQILHSFLIREDCEFSVLTALLTWRYGTGEVYQQLKNYHIERKDVEQDIEYLAREEEKFFRSIQEGRKPARILPEI